MNRHGCTLILLLLIAMLSVTTLNAQSTKQPLTAFGSANRDELVFPKLEPAPRNTGRTPGNFIVDTTTDSQDANPGDEICADASDNCSLRAAIEEANALDPGSTINVPAGNYVLTVNADISYATGLVMIQTMTLTGAGVGQTIIDGNNTSLVMAMGGEGTIIEALTITGGSGLSSGPDTIVGGVYQVGVNTLFRNVSIEDNRADDIGGIAILGTATIENSTINNNWALSGIAGYGTGGVYVGGPGTLLNMTNVTVDGNISATFVGGILVSDGTLILDSSTVSNNLGISDVGGIGIDGVGTATLTNVTVTGNSTSGNGGGLFPIESGALNLNNVTIAYNTADAGGGVMVSGKTTNVMRASINISNSILAMNTADTGPDCIGGLTSTGDNLIGNTADGCTGTAGDILDVNPLLDPLALVAPGLTMTHALQELSPAIDNANDATCETVDQRGVSRPQREGCDMGAFELESLLPTETPTFTPTNTPEAPTATPTEEIAGVELIENGDFEALDGEGKPDITPWVVKNVSGDIAKCNKDKDGDGILDKVVANTGNCAFTFKGVIGDAGKLEQTLDLSGVPLGVGDTMNLTFAAQTKGGGEGKAKVVFKYSDDTKTKISVEVGDTDAVYQLFTGSSTMIGTNIVKSKVSFKLTTETGKLYLDSVSLRLVASDTPTFEFTETETPAARLDGSS